MFHQTTYAGCCLLTESTEAILKLFRRKENLLKDTRTSRAGYVILCCDTMRQYPQSCNFQRKDYFIEHDLADATIQVANLIKYNFIKRMAIKVKQPGLEVINLFPCSTQLSTNFIMLIKVKMPTIVGILTFISMICTTSERLKARYFYICWYFSFYEQV